MNVWVLDLLVEITTLLSDGGAKILEPEHELIQTLMALKPVVLRVESAVHQRCLSIYYDTHLKLLKSQTSKSPLDLPWG